MFFVTEAMNLEYRTDELYRQAEETTVHHIDKFGKKAK